MRLQLQDYCPKNKTTEVIFLFSYPNILFFPLLWKMLFLHLSLFLPSHELFYLPGAHKFPSQYHLTDFLCLPRSSLKRYSLRHQSHWPDPLQLSCNSRDSPDFVALKGCTETDCIFLAPSGKPCSLWGSKKAELQNLGGRWSQRVTKVHTFKHHSSYHSSSLITSALLEVTLSLHHLSNFNFYIIETHKDINWENIQVGFQNWSNICSHVTLQDNTSVKFFFNKWSVLKPI